MKTGSRGVAVIKSCVGLALVTERRGASWIVGYGSPGAPGQRVTPEQAECLLLADLRAVERDLNRRLHRPITQGQFDALVSAMHRNAPSVMAVISRLNLGDVAGAAIMLSGASRRAKAELRMFTAQ